MGCVCFLSCLSPQEVKQYLCGSKLATQETSPSQPPKISTKKKKKKMKRGCCSFPCFSIHQAKYCYLCGSRTAIEEEGETQSSQPRKSYKRYCCGLKLLGQETYDHPSSQRCCLMPCFSRQAAKQIFYRSYKTAMSSQSGKGSNITENIEAKQVTFRKLATITKNFRQECLIGEGGFGRVYKGAWDRSGKVVAVKILDRTLGLQAKEEFLSEVSVLSHLKHTNLVNLVGFCAHGDQRLLVYEYMEMGSLEDHLHGMSEKKRKKMNDLDWLRRMRIAFGVAKGLEYLHCEAIPRVIYGNLKSSNVLLDASLNVKLSDIRVAKRIATGIILDGYYAPEAGESTVKSDIYSFGVMMLELISGRRVIDLMRMSGEQNLVAWARPIFKDPKRFSELVEPDLQGDFVTGELQHAVAIAAMCLQEDAEVRPLITDVVHALSFLGDHDVEDDQAANSHLPPPSNEQHTTNALKSHVSRNISISSRFPNTNSFNF